MNAYARKLVSGGDDSLSSLFCCGLLAILLSSLPMSAPRAHAQQRLPESVVSGELLVGLKQPVPHGSQTLSLSEHTRRFHTEIGTTQPMHPNMSVLRVRIRPGLSAHEAAQALRKREDVAFVEPNYAVHSVSTRADSTTAALAPNDPAYTACQYAPQKMQADRAWAAWKPKAQVVIAVLDSGIDSTHPDLRDKIYRDKDGIIGFNVLTFQRDDALDMYGHGTHCAGIAAASINNGTGIAGIAGWNGDGGTTDSPYIKLMPIKVLDDFGNGNEGTLTQGILWAADNGAKVLTMSVGTTHYSQTLNQAIQYAYSKGCIVVAAAGNNGNSVPFYPAAYPNVISVAATDRNDSLTGWSNYGAWVKVSAPGDVIYSTTPTYLNWGGLALGYDTMSGTSMAAPHIAGEAAMLASQNPSLTNTQIASLVCGSVEPIRQTGLQVAGGVGRANVYQALMNAGTDGGTYNPNIPHSAAFVLQVIPASMIAGQTYPITITLRNTGAATWTTAEGYRLGGQNPQDDITWGGRIELPGSVAPGQTATFQVNVTAPTKAGTYNFQWRMVQDGVEWFGDYTTNVLITVALPSYTPPINPVNRSAFISQSLPTTMTAGQTYPVTVTLRNTGNTQWTAGSFYRLGAQNPQDNALWGTGRVELPQAVNPGDTVTFSYSVTAPTKAGTYNFQWRMVQDGVEWFGDYTTNTMVMVAPVNGVQLNAAAFVSQTVPNSMTPGQTYTVSVTMQNTGTTTWNAGEGYRLGAQAPQDGMQWGFNRVELPQSVPPGGRVTFTFRVTAPRSQAGAAFQWRMVKEFVEWFGDNTPLVAVPLTASTP